MTVPVHTPYDGSARPFSIGLRPLDRRDWIEPDGRLAADLAAKRALFETEPDDVLKVEPGTAAAQAELLGLLLDHLGRHHGDRYQVDAATVTVRETGETHRIADHAAAPLGLAARVIQEDLVMMRKGPGGYRIAAASVCFPSTWRLTDKFSRSMDEIHVPVPGYAETLAGRLNRIFDNLQVERPVWRLNWSLYADAELRHSQVQHERRWFEAPGGFAANAFVRVERQTLMRLPESGDIVFTIRIHVDPIAALRRHPEGAELARSMRGQLLAMDPAQLAYKGLTAHRDRVADELARLADELTGVAA